MFIVFNFNSLKIVFILFIKLIIFYLQVYKIEIRIFGFKQLV